MIKTIKKIRLAAMIVVVMLSVSCTKESNTTGQTPTSLVNTRWETGNHGHMGYALQFLTQTDVAIIDCHYEYDEYIEFIEATTHYQYEAPNGIIFKDNDNMESWSFIVSGNTLTWYAEDVFGSPIAFTLQQ